MAGGLFSIDRVGGDRNSLLRTIHHLLVSYVVLSTITDYQRMRYYHRFCANFLYCPAIGSRHPVSQ